MGHHTGRHYAAIVKAPQLAKLQDRPVMIVQNLAGIIGVHFDE
jgi:hypothetical protein